MSTDPGTAPATGSVSARLPSALIRKLDQLCELTDRTRTYWVEQALEAMLDEELDIAIEFATDHDSPEDIPGDQIEDWLIAHGLTTREALDRGHERLAQNTAAAEALQARRQGAAKRRRA